MIHKIIPMETKNSSKNAKLTTYILDHSEEIGIVKRPAIVVCPGEDMSSFPTEKRKW